MSINMFLLFDSARVALYHSQFKIITILFTCALVQPLGSSVPESSSSISLRKVGSDLLSFVNKKFEEQVGGSSVIKVRDVNPGYYHFKEICSIV